MHQSPGTITVLTNPITALVFQTWGTDFLEEDEDCDENGFGDQTCKKTENSRDQVGHRKIPDKGEKLFLIVNKGKFLKIPENSHEHYSRARGFLHVCW